MTGRPLWAVSSKRAEGYLSAHDLRDRGRRPDRYADGSAADRKRDDAFLHALARRHDIPLRTVMAVAVSARFG